MADLQNPSAPSAEKLQADKDFMSATPADQVKYLSSTDPDFKAAKPEDQAAYLAHVTKQPTGAEDAQNKSALDTATEHYSRSLAPVDEAVTKALAPRPTSDILPTEYREVPKAALRDVYGAGKIATEFLTGFPSAVQHAFGDAPTAEEKAKYADFEKQNGEAPGAETSGFKRIGLGVGRLLGADQAEQAAKYWINPQTRPTAGQVLDVAEPALQQGVGTVVGAELLGKIPGAMADNMPATKQAVQSGIRATGRGIRAVGDNAPTIGSAAGAVTGAVKGGPIGGYFGMKAGYYGGKLMREPIKSVGDRMATAGMTPEERAVDFNTQKAAEADKAAAKAEEAHQNYAASEQRGPIDPETNPAYKKSLDALNKAREAQAEAHFHLQEARRAAAEAAADRGAIEGVGRIITPEEVDAARPQTAPAQLSGEVEQPQVTPQNVKAPGQVQPETFPQEPTEVPRVDETTRMRTLGGNKGVIVGRPPRLLAAGTPEQGAPVEQPKGEILPPEKSAKPGRLGTLKAQGGTIVDTEPDIQKKIEEGLQGTAKPVALPPKTPLGTAAPTTNIPEAPLIAPEDLGLKGTDVRGRVYSPLGTAAPTEEPKPLGKIATPESAKVETKTEEKPKYGPEDTTVADEAVYGLPNDRLKSLGHRFGISPEEVYDFQKREGENKHTVDRTRFHKDTMAKLPKALVDHIISAADDWDAANPHPSDTPSRSQKWIADRSKAIIDEALKRYTDELAEKDQGGGSEVDLTKNQKNMSPEERAKVQEELAKRGHGGGSGKVWKGDSSGTPIEKVEKLEDGWISAGGKFYPRENYATHSIAAVKHGLAPDSAWPSDDALKAGHVRVASDWVTGSATKTGHHSIVLEGQDKSSAVVELMKDALLSAPPDSKISLEFNRQSDGSRTTYKTFDNVGDAAEYLSDKGNPSVSGGSTDAVTPAPTGNYHPGLAESDDEMARRGASVPDTFFHGANSEGTKAIESLGLIRPDALSQAHLTPDRATAEAYAKANGGKVFSVKTKDIPSDALQHFTETGRGPVVLRSTHEVPVQEAEPKGAHKPGEAESDEEMARRGANVPELDIAKAADDYNREHGLHPIQPEKLDTDKRVAEIADAFDAMKHDPDNPAVKASYDALKEDIKKQWDYATKTLGIKIEPTDSDPYGFTNGEKPAEQQLFDDVKNNKHLGVFRGGNPLMEGHPLSEVDPETGENYNTMFRAIHDLFGHVAQGHDFSERGEESAWNAHMQMMDPAARPAMTTETRGQTSWFFNREPVRLGEEASGKFADQKAGLLPDFAMERNAMKPKEVFDHIKSDEKPFAIITAENPNNARLADAENAKRNHELLTDLKEKGYEPKAVGGVNKDVPGKTEHAFFVPDIKPEDAIELGNKHGQESILTQEGLHHLDNNTVNPADNKGLIVGDKAKEQPYYSVVDGEPFSVPLDFDKVVTSKNQKNMSPEERAKVQEELAKAGVSGGSGRALPSGDQLIKKYGETDDPSRTAFLLFDGRGVELPLGSEHDIMLGGKPTDNLRTQFINDEQAIRMRAHGAFGGRQFNLSLPESGISEKQLAKLLKWEPQFRSGTQYIEVAKPDGKSITLQQGSGQSLEKAIKQLVPVTKEESGLPELAEKHLTPEERQGVTKSPKSLQRFVERMSSLPAVQEWTDAALKGAAERKWYQRSGQAFDAMSKEAPEYFDQPGDRDKFVGLLASGSPQQPVVRNMREALRVWTNYVDNGRPTGAKLEKLLSKPSEAGGFTLPKTKVPNAMKALAGEPLWPDITKNKNFKVSSFRDNLTGMLNKVTNDGWLALFAELKPKDISSAHSYHPISVMIRAAAEELGWEPAEAQAAIWAFIKTLTEKGVDASEDPYTMRQYSEDFADIMLHDAETRALLKDMGVDHAKLDERLAKEVERKPKPVASGGSPTSEDSARRAFERVETARGKGTIPAAKTGLLNFGDYEDENTSFRPEDFGPRKSSPLGKIKKKGK